MAKHKSNDDKRAPVALINEDEHWNVILSAQSIKAKIFYLKNYKIFKQKLLNKLTNILANSISIFKIPESKYYLITGDVPLTIMRIKKALKQDSSTVIHYVINNYYTRRMHSGFKFSILCWLARIVDGIIVPGTSVKKDVEENFNVPTYTTISYPKSTAFQNINADVKSKNIVTVGVTDWYTKGIDKVMEIAKKLPNYNFFLLGRLTKPDFKKLPNVHFTGQVNPVEYYKKSKYFILPGRFDAGPTAIIEGIASGMIPLIGPYCGSADIIQEVRTDLVIKSNKSLDFVEKILELENLSTSSTTKLSKKAKKIAANCTKEKGQADFRKKFYKLVKEINLQAAN